MRLTVCPTCKQAVAVNLPVVDLNTNEVSYGGVTQKMSGTQVEVLAAIMVRFPKTATYHEIAKDVWGNHKPGLPYRNLHLHVFDIRQMTKGFPFTIKTQSTVGYRFAWREGWEP